MRAWLARTDILQVAYEAGRGDMIIEKNNKEEEDYYEVIKEKRDGNTAFVCSVY